MNTYNEQKRERAQKRVKDIKGFYTHLLVYLVINTFLTIVHFWLDGKGFYGENFLNINYWGTPLAWGVGLLIHGIKVFSLSKWEDKKIRELMEEDHLTSESQKEVEGSWWE